MCLQILFNNYSQIYPSNILVKLMESRKQHPYHKKSFKQYPHPSAKGPNNNKGHRQLPVSQYKSSGRGFSETITLKPISHSSKTSLVTNHFPIKIKDPSLKIYIYSIHVAPCLPQNESASITVQLLEMHDQSIKKNLGNMVVYTQAHSLYSLQRLKDADNLEFQCKLGDCQYILEIRYADTFYLNEKRSESQLYINLCFKYLFKNKLNFTSLGNSQSIFNLSKQKNFKEICVVPGYHASAKIADSGMFLVIEPINKFLVPNNMLDMFNNLWKYKKGNRKEIEHRFNNIAVMANYGRRRIHRVIGIDLDKTPQNTKVDGQDITILKYYLNNYNIRIKNPKQPLLLSQISHQNTLKGKFTYLVPELVSQAHIPPRIRNNRKLMQQCSMATCPSDQFEKCIELSKTLQGCQQLLKQCGLELYGMSKKVQAYNLQRVKLANGQLAEESSMKNNLKNDCQNLSNWAIVYNPYTAYIQTDAMYNGLSQFGNKIGIKVSQPEWLELEKSSQDCYQRALKKGIQKHRVVVVVLERESFYPALKKICAEDKGIISQFVIKNTLKCWGGKFNSIIQNLMRQIQVKLGHDLYQLKIDKALIDPSNKKAKTMIVGYDVSRRGSSSMVGFCASINRNMTQFYSNFFKQEESCQEIVAAIHLQFEKAIKNFEARNGCTPQLIVVFRDGVGNSMIEQVRSEEIEKLIPKMKTLNCRVCFMTMKKRTHERFFLNEQRDIKNARPGTAIISDVVQQGMIQRDKKLMDINKKAGKEKDKEDNKTDVQQTKNMILENRGQQFDFFLIPHSCGIGVAKATHIHVIYNDSELSKKAIVQMSNTLCYGYFNWAGAVRIPSACMYAHKLSLFATTVKCKPNKLLENNLHFL